MGKFRIEEDSLGKVKVPEGKFWGAQTQRSLENFRIGEEKIPLSFIYALAIVKKAATIVNCELGVLLKQKRDLIVAGCDAILRGDLDDQFPLVVWQTGSGTQTNMNINEVISNWCSKKVGEKLGSKKPIHPNDDVNKSQSSNDVFPTAMHISAVMNSKKQLLPELRLLQKSLEKKSKEFHKVVKVGRTHLMDAAPLSLGQEFSGYARQIEEGIRAIENAIGALSEIALGGTAVGTGLNAPRGYAKKVAEVISKLTGHPFSQAKNKFEALASNDAIVEMSGALKRVACSYMKIANDIRWMASGPRAGLGEIFIPENEPGSSIMPGKVNPTQTESMTSIAAQVMGNDAAIGFAGSMGNFELNVFKPLLIYNLLQSIRLLGDSAKSFRERCVDGIKPNLSRIKKYLDQSLMLATALNPVIGYDKASKVVKEAYKRGITLKEAAVHLGFLTEKQFDRIVDPQKMI
ncbi:MAG: class II fumarate hydratase [Chlamydiae bacterium]|nr:class II fumarate hydratase [Chlamydiota bacterium]